MLSKRSRLSLGLAAVLLTSLFAASGVLADFSLKDWRYYKPITLPSTINVEGFVELLPDVEIFAGSSSTLTDLRIIADDGTEVPYKLEVSRSERQSQTLSVQMRDQGYIVGQYTTFIVDLGRRGIRHNQVEITVDDFDFRRTATVETSDDGDMWAEVADKKIYDFTVEERSFTARDTLVAYPDSTARFLRVKIADEGEGPLEVASASVFFVRETPAKEVRWPRPDMSAQVDPDRQATIVELDLGTTGIPTSRMVLEIDDDNFYREVTLEESDDRGRWTTVLDSNIFSYNTSKFVGYRFEFSYREIASRYLRLVIRNQDSPPLDIKAADVWGFQRRLVFEADPSKTYAVYYGNSDARKPNYDIEQVFPYLETEDLPRVQVGQQFSNPDFVEKKPPVSERFPWLLPFVIGIVALAVALILFGVIRQARKVLPPPS